LKLLAEVMDPEIPVVSIIDLGILRSVNIKDESRVHVVITPTYSGCPAMDVIAFNIRVKLMEHGFRDVTIEQTLSPAWTTDWMTTQGKEKLKAYGIAPPNPVQSVCNIGLFQEDEAIQCPHCNSYQTQLISQFGSTACKALYRCNSCEEAFDYFKCH
jgi:ring-1,2-phenylacetyl-CoA epoxidase subunit PaaD